MNLDKYHHIVKKILPPARYQHTLGVIELSKKIGETYKVSLTSLEVAGLFHDITKYFTLEELKKYISSKELTSLLGFESNREILHGFASAGYIEKELGITDPSILNAIRYHTIGRKGMDTIEKIIYIADAAEKGRNYLGVEDIRRKLEDSLDEAILLEIQLKTTYLNKLGVKIHPNLNLMKDDISEQINRSKGSDLYEK